MGWVSLLTVLLVVRPWIQPGGTVSAQLWEPERRAKSLGFLGKGEDGQIREVEDNGIEGDVEKKETEKKKAILNVSDKDSPYALIDKYFPERDSYFYQNRKKFLHEFRESGGASGDIGGLDPSEVWLAEDSLLVLKGGSTPDREGFDNPWRPIDDFEAPYREPVLPPADFDPDSLDIGVGVPIETIVREQRERRDRESLRELPLAPRHVTTQDPRHVSLSEAPRHVSSLSKDPRHVSPPPRHVTTQAPRHVSLSEAPRHVSLSEAPRHVSLSEAPRHVSLSEAPRHVSSLPEAPRRVSSLPEAPRHVSPIHNSIEADPLKPYKDEVDAGHEEFRQFLDDVSQFIADMESFHSVKQQSASKTQVRTLPPPVTTSRPPVTQTTVTSRSPFPISYTSPNARVFLSTNYISHTPSKSVSTVSSTASPHRKQARSTILPPTSSPVTTRSSTSDPGDQEQEDWTPVTTAPAVITKYSREHEFKSVVKQLPPRVTPLPPVRQSIRPSAVPHHTSPSPSYGLRPPAPTPFSLFQSVPENFQETDVFHLSQNVDFGKKLGVGSGPASGGAQPRLASHDVAFNEVDTGAARRQRPEVRGRYSVSVTTAPPPRRPQPKAHPPQQRPQAKLGGLGGLDSLLPSIFTGPPRGRGRGRSTVRRRRPKFIGPAKASDRQGNGDVRYVSFFSGGPGTGNAWGYSYNLG